MTNSVYYAATSPPPPPSSLMWIGWADRVKSLAQGPNTPPTIGSKFVNFCKINCMLAFIFWPTSYLSQLVLCIILIVHPFGFTLLHLVYVNTHQVWKQIFILPTAGKYWGRGCSSSCLRLSFPCQNTLHQPPLHHDSPTGSNRAYIEASHGFIMGGTGKKSRSHMSH